MKTRTLLSLVAALFFVGCNSSQTASDSPDAAPAPKPRPTASVEPRTPTAPTVSRRGEIPDELRHDAYRYHGLDRVDPISLDVTAGTQPEPSRGTQQYSLLGTKPGIARFKVERSGSLDVLGTDVWRVTKDGIQLESTSLGKLSGTRLALPASLKPGTKWTTTHKIVREKGNIIEETVTNTVVGPQQVQTKAGTQEALLVRGEGRGVANGQRMRIESRTWYVKDRGPVRIEINAFPESGGKTTLTMEEAPAGP